LIFFHSAAFEGIPAGALSIRGLTLRNRGSESFGRPEWPIVFGRISRGFVSSAGQIPAHVK
jgi:hypothetical protein